MNDSSSQVIDSRTITTNKSSMRKYLLRNLNFVEAILSNKNKQGGKAAAPANMSQGVKSN